MPSFLFSVLPGECNTFQRILSGFFFLSLLIFLVHLFPPSPYYSLHPFALFLPPSLPPFLPHSLPPSLFAGEAAVVGRRCPRVLQGSGVAVEGVCASLTGDGARLPKSRLTAAAAAAAIFFRAALCPRPPPPPRAAGPAAAPYSLIPLHLAPPLPPRGKTSRMGTGPRAPSSPSPTTNHPRVGTGPAATVLPVCTTSKR